MKKKPNNNNNFLFSKIYNENIKIPFRFALNVLHKYIHHQIIWFGLLCWYSGIHSAEDDDDGDGNVNCLQVLMYMWSNKMLYYIKLYVELFGRRQVLDVM